MPHLQNKLDALARAFHLPLINLIHVSPYLKCFIKITLSYKMTFAGRFFNYTCTHFDQVLAQPLPVGVEV